MNLFSCLKPAPRTLLKDKAQKKAFLTVFFLLSLFAACAPAPTPVPAPPDVSSVDLVATFYDSINEAQTENQLSKPWKMLSLQGQCSPVHKCDFSYFQTKWMQWKVSYKLYDCGSNIVIAEEIRHAREGSPPSELPETRHFKYKLAISEDVLMIDAISVVQKPGDDCPLKIEATASP